VRVVTDWTGTGHRTSQKLHKQFHEAGVQHRSFNPWFRRGLARTHRKICVVDCETAFLGGLNINDDLIADDGSGKILPAPRWDFAIRIVGELVKAIHSETEAQWERLGPGTLRTRWQAFKKSRGVRIASSEAPATAALVVRDTLRNRRTIQRAYLNALGHARESAMLANPYFAPGRKMRDALSTAAARGVKVTLLLGVGQFALQDAVARAYYPKLLRNGVKIVEYRRTQLHGKVAVVDDDWATVGSSNYDGLSLFVNHEANVVVRDQAFTAELRRHIAHGVEQGVAIRPEDFAHIAWYRRAWYGFAFFVYRSAMRLVTGGKFV
jgi:cardiolipin synthase